MFGEWYGDGGEAAIPNLEANAFTGGSMNPFDMLGGLPSFSGGDAGPAMGRSDNTIWTNISPGGTGAFNVGSSGPLGDTVKSIAPLVIAGLALWFVLGAKGKK